MKIDTSSYYPEPLFGDEGSGDSSRENERFMPGYVDHEKGKESDPETGDDNGSVAEEPSEQKDDREKKENSTPSGKPEMEYPDSDLEAGVTWLSNIISWIFVPLLMPVYGILLAFNLSILEYTVPGAKTIFTLITAAFNVGIPAVLFYLLKKLGVIQDIGLNGQKERLVPYIITIICMLSCGAFIWYKGAPMWLVMFFAGGALAGLINMLINFKWKISAHSAGIAGLVALLLRIMHDGFPQHDIVLWIMIVVGVAGLLGSARVWLGRHTVMQVLAGYVVGFCSVFFLTMIH